MSAGGKTFKDAAARAGGLYVALGTHFLGADRCRQAVRDFRAASTIAGEVIVGDNLAKAEECAVTPIAVMPFDNPTGINPSGLALGDTLADQVLSDVKTKASEFIHIVDRTAIETILQEQGLTGASPKGLRGVRFLVTERLTQVMVVEPELASTAATAKARERYVCTKTNSQGQSVQAECVRDIVLNYVDYKSKSSVKLVASAKVIDVKTGEQVGAPQLTALIEDSIHYADNFFASGVATNPTTMNRSDGTETYDEAVIALSKAPRSVKPTTVLVDQAINKLGADLATEIVRQVDAEGTITDPATLTLSASK